MQRSVTGLVLGYHGCSREVADRLIGGEAFRPSQNPYDWLGDGVYFWESDPVRALQWANDAVARKSYNDAAVIGAVLDLELCLDLTTQSSLDVIRTAYEDLQTLVDSLGETLVENRSGLLRQRDNAVLNYLYESMPEPKFQTVRGVFTEGDWLYPGARIHSQTHVQIAVRDLNCIKGVFRPAMPA